MNISFEHRLQKRGLSSDLQAHEKLFDLFNNQETKN